ncbi:hypothetical protein [Rhodoligotrophos defluvii]|uniref:hypothetical protein n=1 Tax=Rhodoligotrophos defluvii TaxID=2561934 RepID=UPI0010C9FD2A|nr:hypothetical protein [Rhodoligotrophos defluvii]
MDKSKELIGSLDVSMTSEEARVNCECQCYKGSSETESQAEAETAPPTVVTAAQDMLTVG